MVVSNILAIRNICSTNCILHFHFLNIGFWDIKEARLVSSCAKCHDATSRSRQRKRPCLYFIVWILLIKKMTQHKICNFLFDTFLNLRRSFLEGLFITVFISDVIIFCGYPRFSLLTTHVLTVYNVLSIKGWSDMKPAENDDLIYEQPLSCTPIIMSC